MGKINVCGLEEKDDPFYRYQMEKFVVTRQKKGRTVVENLENVAKDIERDPILIIEFFKRKFSTNFIFKKGILTTSRDINYKELEIAIREFIEYFVLCSICRLPETTITKNSNKFFLNCKCCSNISPLESTGKNKFANKTIDNIAKLKII